MRTYKEARKEYLESFPQEYDMEEEGIGGTTFGLAIETEFGWYFGFDSVNSMISDFPWFKSDVGYDMITKEENDTNRYPGLFDNDSPTIISKTDRIGIWRSRFLAMKNRFFSRVYLVKEMVVYSYFAFFVKTIKVADILYLGRLVSREASLNMMDWHLVIVERKGRVVFIPLNSSGFIRFWSKTKLLFPGERVWLPVFPSSDTESVLAYPVSDK